MTIGGCAFRLINLCVVASLLLGTATDTASAAEPVVGVRQLTHGPKHHFFGYIGHVRTISWNASGRYALALETDFQDRMPDPGDAAQILLLDARANYAPKTIERTRAWNFQQGTMMYWNPREAETQFFFNDRDPATNRVFTVCCDLSGARPVRRREYRFEDVAVANSGVAPSGGRLAAINYGRLARLRPVTGYPQAHDATAAVNAPQNDGVFVIDIATGARRLLVSFRQLADAIRPMRPDIDQLALFINHTLWSPDGERLFFFCRADFEQKTRLDIPFVVMADGTGLAPLKHHIGGHPEWLDGRRMIGRRGRKQVAFDVAQQEFVRTFGDDDTFADAGGDIALSPNGRWLVNGASIRGENRFTFYRLDDGTTIQAGPLSRGKWTAGELRIDAAPCWNRESTAVVTTAVAADENRTRQMFLLELPEMLVATSPEKNSSPTHVKTPGQREYRALDLSNFQDGIKHWNDQFGRDRHDPRYEPTQIVEIAENLVAYQNADGGWPKNIDWLLAVDPAEIRQVIGERRLRSTLDNRNTYSQIEYLARAFQESGDARFRTSAEKGIDYLLKEQRPTGGWRGWDVDAITYNDEVMIGVMRLLRRIAAADPVFDWLSDERREAARRALDRAIAVTLKCQIVVDGQRTAWCQQHDHTTLAPVKARTYELPSRCPAETTTIVEFLMEIEHPSVDVVAAVDGAVAWLRQAQLEGIRVDRVRIEPVRFESYTATSDVVVVQDPRAPALWARYYELDSTTPFFANRDGKQVASLAEVALERRSGYGWYGRWPARLLAETYPQWRSRLAKRPGE